MLAWHQISLGKTWSLKTVNKTWALFNINQFCIILKWQTTKHANGNAGLKVVEFCGSLKQNKLYIRYFHVTILSFFMSLSSVLLKCFFVLNINFKSSRGGLVRLFVRYPIQCGIGLSGPWIESHLVWGTNHPVKETLCSNSNCRTPGPKGFIVHTEMLAVTRKLRKPSIYNSKNTIRLRTFFKNSL